MQLGPHTVAKELFRAVSVHTILYRLYVLLDQLWQLQGPTCMESAEAMLITVEKASPKHPAHWRRALLGRA